MNNQQQVGTSFITNLEKSRESKVIVYCTGDRQPLGAARIAEDAVRPLYDHLVNLDFESEKKKIDLYIYSRGGDVSVPWRIASMFREFCDEFNILIPYKAHSAATLLSLGADNIIMGRKAELGPIDPTLSRSIDAQGTYPLQEISVEDVNAFLSFIKNRANINDQTALAKLVGLLVEQITPLTLGRVDRQDSHIRLVARKLLTSHNSKMEEDKLQSIIETLTEKIYSHGHAIGRKEAKDIGLPVETADVKMEELMWNLYLEYENFLQLNDPIDPEIELGELERKTLDNIPIAVMESAKKLHIFKDNIQINKNRQIPPSPQININININLPSDIKPNQIPQRSREVLQEMNAQITNQMSQMVQQEIVRQSPIVGFSSRSYGGKWHTVK